MTMRKLYFFIFAALFVGSTVILAQDNPAKPATAPAKAIGPAPANTPQHQILNTALSPETRQTLQQAMNSAPAPAAK